MKLSYRIPGSETPPRLEITRDERGLTIRVGRLKEFTNRVHTVGNYLAGIVIVLVANGGIALAMIRAMARGRRLEALHLLVVESLVGLVTAVVILVLHDRHNRWAIFNVNSDGLRIGTHGPFGVRRRFFRRDRIISIECQKSHDQAPADDWSAWHYLAVTSRHTRSYSGRQMWLNRYPEDLIRKVADELCQALSLPREKSGDVKT
jgi:hypothetical protein